MRLYIDLDRVGVHGDSSGGYHAALTIMLHNEFYDAAVSSAGAHRWEAIYPGFETSVGVPDYGDGSVSKPEEGAAPQNLVDIGNLRYVDRLQGHSLLMYGEHDENVPPSQVVMLMDE